MNHKTINGVKFWSFLSTSEKFNLSHKGRTHKQSKSAKYLAFAAVPFASSLFLGHGTSHHVMTNVWCSKTAQGSQLEGSNVQALRAHLTLEDWTTILSANAGHQSPSDAAPYPRLRVSVSTMLTTVYGVYGPKKEETTGGLTKLHNEELHNLYSASNILGQ
jgi:hypothetical protein